MSSAAAPAASKASDFGLAQVRLINDQTAQAWKEHKLVPSKAATDGEWCRRVYLDMIGRVPTVEELTAYLADKKHDKREQLVDRLLGRRVQRRVRAQLDDDLDEYSDRPDGRERSEVAGESRGDGEVSRPTR